MKIGLDAFVLQYELSGIGNYTLQMILNLQKYFPEHEYGLYIEKDTLSETLYADLITKKFTFENLEITKFSSFFFLNKFYKYTRDRLLPIPFVKEHLQFALRYPSLYSIHESKKDSPDVFHAVDWLFIPNKKAKKNVITIFDLTARLFPNLHDELSILKEKEKQKELKYFDTFICISESTRNDLIHYYSIPKDRTLVSYPCVHPIYETESYLPEIEIRKKYAIPEDSPYFLSVSTIEPRKNLKRVLEAFALFTEKHAKEKTYLVLVGAWAWKNEIFKKFLESYSYRDRLIFTGYASLSDLPSLYHYATCFLYLSLYEGFGLPVLEAMHSKTPVIASNISSIPEILSGAGILVSPANTEEVFTAMETIFHKEEYRKQLIQLGKEKAKTFNSKKSSEEIIRAYCE